jgi:hypothetical protein
MSSIPLTEDTKLEELIDKAVQRHLKLTIEDMEVVRRSPAASIIRLEQKVELMVTKEEFREELTELEKRLGERIEKQGEKIEKQGERIEKQGERIGGLEGAVAGIKLTQKLLISLYLSILGIVGAMFVKMFFF